MKMKQQMKSHLRTISLTAILLFAFFATTTYFSCKKDSCKSVACANGGVCTDGKCVCPSGYEGNYCETVNRDRYLGSWNVAEKGTITNEAQYTISVEKGDNILELRIKNLRNLFTQDVHGWVKTDTVYIPQQTINSIYSVVGNGIITDDKHFGDRGKLIVRYQVTDLTTGLVDDFGYAAGDSSVWHK